MLEKGGVDIAIHLKSFKQVAGIIQGLLYTYSSKLCVNYYKNRLEYTNYLVSMITFRAHLH